MDNKELEEKVKSLFIVNNNESKKEESKGIIDEVIEMEVEEEIKKEESEPKVQIGLNDEKIVQPIQINEKKRPKLELPEIELPKTEEQKNETLKEYDPELYAEWLEIVSGIRRPAEKKKEMTPYDEFAQKHPRLAKIRDFFRKLINNGEKIIQERQKQKEFTIPRGENREELFSTEESNEFENLDETETKRDVFVEQLKQSTENDYPEIRKVSAAKANGGPIER